MYKEIDKPLSLRMAILKLVDGQQHKAKKTKVEGSQVVKTLPNALVDTGFPPNVIANFANGVTNVSDEVFEDIMAAYNCRLYCPKRTDF